MKIAIQGHPDRGKEVIHILESLGGVNRMALKGNSISSYYRISYDNNNLIICSNEKIINEHYEKYTLEEFEKEFPFKVGDKVIYSYASIIIGIVVDIKFNDHIPYRVDIKGKICTCGTSALKPYKEMKEERNITLTLEKAKEWYKKGGELKEIALQAFSEQELNPLPKSWDEFCEKFPIDQGEAYINSVSKVIEHKNPCKRDLIEDKHACPSRKSAEAHLAMIQLEQLRDCWRQNWVPNWSDRSEKWCIALCGNELSVSITTIIPRFLTFPTKEIAREFLKCFKDLIEKAGDLI